MLSNNAEGGVSGVTVTPADTGSGDQWTAVQLGAAGIIQYSNAFVGNGSLAYRIASRATGEVVYLGWNNATAGASWYNRVYVTVDAMAATAAFVSLRQSAAGAILGYLSWNNPAPYHFSIRDGSASSQWTSTTTLTLGTYYRVEFLGTAAGATGTIQARIYQGNSTTLLEDSGPVTVTASASFTTWQYMRFGNTLANANIPSSTGFIYLDDPVAFATTWPGPAVTTSQFARPSSDVAAAGWTPSTGATLFGTIDESPADDADYITSPSSRLWTPRTRRVVRPHDDVVIPSRRKVMVPCR